MSKPHSPLAAFAFALPFVGAGCSPPDPNDVPYVVVVDDAEIKGQRWDGTPWCRTGLFQSAYVAATFGSGIQTTPAADGLLPSWRVPVINAVAAAYNFGTLFDVVGLCEGDPSPLRLGAALVHPDVGVLQRSTVSVRNFGGVALLRFHFVRAEKYAPPPGGAYADVPAPTFWQPMDVADHGNGWASDNGEGPWRNDRAPPPPSLPCNCTTTGGGVAGGGVPGGGDGTDPGGGGGA